VRAPPKWTAALDYPVQLLDVIRVQRQWQANAAQSAVATAHTGAVITAGYDIDLLNSAW
jgi:hypothetical protein